MASLDVYSTDAHLGFRDRELFEYYDVSYRIDHRQARKDVDRELLRRGFTGGLEDILDTTAEATCTLTFVAESGGGGATVPAGYEVFSAEDRTKVVFETDEALVLADGATGTVSATCQQFGEPGNVAEGVLIYHDGLSGLTSVTNAEVATGGENHQLTEACVFRALEMVYCDLSRDEGDAYDHKSKKFGKRYREQLDLILAAGLLLDSSSGVPTDVNGRAYPRFRLERS